MTRPSVLNVNQLISEDWMVRNTTSIPGDTTADALEWLKSPYSGISVPIAPYVIAPSSSWGGGGTDDFRGGGTGGALFIALPLYPGAALTQVRVSIEPSTGHSTLPSGMPFFNVFTTSPFAHSSAGISGTIADATNNVTAYEVQHTLVLTLGTPLTPANAQSAWLRINDETGISGLRLKSIIATYS